MIIDCISDLHGVKPKLEGGDLLIVAGDLTSTDEYDQYVDFCDWLEAQPYRLKVIIAGNHDNKIQEGIDFDFSDLNIKYLEDSECEFEGLKIWGSPWTKTFEKMNPHCKAFTFDTEEELDSKFSLIPDDIDILITHSPPFAIRDLTIDGRNVGSISLLTKILNVRPRLHVFGHIHEDGGQQLLMRSEKGDNEIQFINASQVNERYLNVHKPIRVIL